VNLLFKLAFIPSKQLGFFALVLSGLFYVSPLYDDGSSLEGTINSLRAQMAQEEERKVKTEQILGERDRLQETLAKLTDQYEALSRKIPSELTSSEVNKQINELIQNAKLKSISRKPLPEENIGILDEIPYDLTLQGSFNEIGQFINAVSISERVILVKSFTLVSQAPIYNGQLTFNVVISAYKLSSNPDLSKLPGAGVTQ
jgi:type IV pilus assembly protein PilO